MSQPQSAPTVTAQVIEVLGNLAPLLLVAELLRAGLEATSMGVPFTSFYMLYCIWLGFGHLALYATNSFPVIRRSSWARGNVTAMLGLFWPAWLALAKQAHPKTS